MAGAPASIPEPIDLQNPAGVNHAQLYYLDEHGAAAFGLRLTAGRWFTAADMPAPDQSVVQPVAILTRALAKQLFPNGHALGGIVYTQGPGPTTIVGIVENLQSS